MGHRVCAYFGDTVGLTLLCRRQSSWICVVFSWCGSGPAGFVLFRCFLYWKNANLAGGFACRRCCRVSSRCVGFSMICLVGEAKVFHTFCKLFHRFSHYQNRIGRNRGRKKLRIELFFRLTPHNSRHHRISPRVHVYLVRVANIQTTCSIGLIAFSSIFSWHL